MKAKTKLLFLGAVGTVTGSKYLLTIRDKRILIDCGLFQGFKQLRLRNWAALPVSPRSIDAVILTHAHIDHSGYLPLLVRNGFRGPIFCTKATAALCKILLPDSGFLQEKDAEFANRHGFSKHHPAQPLYTARDADRALEHFRSLSFDDMHTILPDLHMHFLHAGHILGAAILKLKMKSLTLTFSGDLGRFDNSTMVDPAFVDQSDYLVVESTYGNKRHATDDVETVLSNVINRTSQRGGTLIIPTFAVGRTQALLFHLNRLKDNNLIADLPVFLDSPMAIDASVMFSQFLSDQKLSAHDWAAACAGVHYVRDSNESKALDENPHPKIIISASGMATGGRVLHHLKAFAPDDRNTILFSGFQAGGTRGAAMIAGARTIKIHGHSIPVNAEICQLDMLSAHADADEIMKWLSHFTTAPQMTFVTHGEPEASDCLRHRISEELGWRCMVPEYLGEYQLL